MTYSDALRQFLATELHDCFDRGFARFWPLTSGTTAIVDNELVEVPPCEAYGLSIASEADRFEGDVRAWEADVHEIREAWLWDNDALSLDTNYRHVFGDAVCNRLDGLRARCRRLLAAIEAADNTEAAAADEKDRWSKAVTCLTAGQAAIVNAIRDSPDGLTYLQLASPKEAVADDIVTQSAARRAVKRIRDTWQANGVPFEIPQPRRGGKLTVSPIISEKNVTVT